MEEYIVLGNLVLGIVNISTITYLCVKTYYMEKFLNTIPSKEEMIKEIVKTKIPMILGPDGQPMMPGMAPPKPDKNPLTG